MTLTDETGQGAVQDEARGVPDLDPDVLVVAGRPITSRLIMGTGGAANLDFRDPDGHPVELITPGFWAIY